MKKLLFSLLLISGISAAAQNAAAPEHAKIVLSNAMQEASASHKNIIIKFSASWCVWCRRMDSSIHDAAIEKYFTDNYVIKTLDVDERPEKKNLENPAASDFRNAYGGQDQGLPFWLVLDASGKLLYNSRMPGADAAHPGDNTGCPSTQQEVDYLVTVLKNTSKLSDTELAKIAARFRKNEH